MHNKVDEDLPLVAAEWLQTKGYQASTVVDQNMGGWKDTPLWEAVQAQQKFLLTAAANILNRAYHKRIRWNLKSSLAPT